MKLSGILFLVVNIFAFAAGFIFIWGMGYDFSVEAILSLAWLFLFQFYVKRITSWMKKRREKDE